MAIINYKSNPKFNHILSTQMEFYNKVDKVSYKSLEMLFN